MIRSGDCASNLMEHQPVNANDRKMKAAGTPAGTAKTIIMASVTFKRFVQKLSKSPPQAIIGALDRECNRLRRSLVESRDGLPDQAYSILYFKIFVRAAMLGEVLDLTIQLPADEVEFFQKTTIRLVQVNALPISALDHFQSTFRVTDKARHIHMRREMMNGYHLNGFKRRVSRENA
jgi:hypothetical protein